MKESNRRLEFPLSFSPVVERHIRLLDRQRWHGVQTAQSRRNCVRNPVIAPIQEKSQLCAKKSHENRHDLATNTKLPTSPYLAERGKRCMVRVLASIQGSKASEEARSRGRDGKKKWECYRPRVISWIHEKDPLLIHSSADTWNDRTNKLRAI